MELLYKNPQVEIFFDSRKSVIVQRWIKDVTPKQSAMSANKMASQCLKDLLCTKQAFKTLDPRMQGVFLELYAYKMPRA